MICMARKLSHGTSPTARRLLLAALWLVVSTGLLSGCGGEPDVTTPIAAKDFSWPTGPNPHVTLHVAGKGDIEIELYPQLAPRSVEAFIELAKQGFYDGTTFHRVLPGFMIQGGDPLSKDEDPSNDGMGDAEQRLPDEFSDAPHLRGVVSLANRGRDNSASCQFFIVHADSQRLDGKHTAIGRVVDGMDVVDAISEVEIDRYGRWGKRHRPLQDVVISGVTVSESAGTTAESAATSGVGQSTS